MVRFDATAQQMSYRNRRATLLINPAARGARNFDVVGALARLREGGLTPRLVVSRNSVHATGIAHQAVDDGDDLVFVVGGDGSARVIAGALAGSNTALATLRAGTANVWAHEMGIPSGLKGIDAHLSGQVVSVDLCYRDDEPFLLMAGIGWDAEIAGRVRESTKRLLGPGAYVLEAARAMPGLRPAEMHYTIDGVERTTSAAQVVLGNTRLYGSVAHLTPGAIATDGQMDVMIVSPGSVGAGLATVARLAIPKLGDGSSIWRGRATRFTIETPGLPVQLDGDPSGETPASFRVAPGVLKVSVPAGPLPAVLGG